MSLLGRITRQNVKHESGNYDLSDSFTAVDSIGHGDKEQHHWFTTMTFVFISMSSCEVKQGNVFAIVTKC